MEIIDHESYISFEVAKLLEKAGFDWESHFTCEQQQDKWQQSASIEVPNPQYDKSIPFSSPTNIVVLPHVTLDVAQRWLREVKNEYVVIEIDAPGFYKVSILGRNCISKLFKTYEEAQEAGIKAALELILEKGE